MQAISAGLGGSGSDGLISIESTGELTRQYDPSTQHFNYPAPGAIYYGQTATDCRAYVTDNRLSTTGLDFVLQAGVDF